MRILIKVTKDILEQSAFCKISEAGTHCAIALAIRDLFPDARVRDSYIAFFNEGNGYITSARLPVEAKDFIHDFDYEYQSPSERVNMRPISFYIDVPDQIIEKIGISEAERIISNSLTMEKV